VTYKRVDIVNIYEVIRRWHTGQKITSIAANCDYDRKTVRKYIQLAVEKGITPDSPLPTKDDLLSLLDPFLAIENQKPAPAQNLLNDYLQEIVDLVNTPTNALIPKIAFEVICEKHDLTGKVSYSTFKRFAKAHDIYINPDKITCRIEVDPASEIQIDYGLMGLLFNPNTCKKHKVYAFIATLSYSRHMYVEFVYKQDQQSFVASHVRMFEYFGGVAEKTLIDNLKAGVIKPDLYDPTLNRSYRELSEHYGFFIDTCRPGHPKDKGKVENQVKVVRQQFRKQLALNPNMDIAVANELVLEWCLGKHGNRIHGTTGWQPLPTFLKIEKPALRPLPDEPFEVPLWKEATVHPDSYIQFKKKSYSVPYLYCGKKLWVRGTEKLVQIYYENLLVKQHLNEKNIYRYTDHTDFPENIQAVLDKGLPKYLQDKAAQISYHFGILIRQVLEPHAFFNLRKAQGLLSLAEKFAPDLVETAAKTALDRGISITPKSFKMLLQKLQITNKEQIPISKQTELFIRSMDYFVRNS
jgi:transposase